MARCTFCGKDWPAALLVCPEHHIQLVDPHAVSPSVDPQVVITLREKNDDDLPPASMVGEYRIIGQLGQGGMGTVYSAMHPVIGKKAAVKVINKALSVNLEAVERFVQEARAVNQIGHPNIVDVFSFGTLPDGRSYFVMEWLQGETLGTRLQRGRIDPGDAIEILDAVASALEVAHEKGITHRDLKPENVFLVDLRNQAPMVKLLDFGIAKLSGPEDTRGQRTLTGMMLGTPLYMSPEQARGKHIDLRSDVYSLGVIAYEMFLGRPPFQSDNAADLIALHLKAALPEPRSLWPEIPLVLNRLLVGMLEKDASARPSLEVVRQVLADLRASGALDKHVPRAVLHSLPSDEATVSTRKRRWLRVSLFSVGAVGAGLLLVRLSGTPRPPAVAPAQIAAPVAPSAPERAPAVPPSPPVFVPQTGTLRIDANQRTAAIEVDGQPVPLETARAGLQVESGRHLVVVTALGRQPFRESVSVATGTTVELAPALAPALPPPKAPSARAQSTRSRAYDPVRVPAPDPVRVPSLPRPPEDDNVPIDPFTKGP